MKLPKAKTENIVVQHLPNETLIYNLTTNQAFHLNETSAKIFNACDGTQTFDDLKKKYNLTDELIYLALDELKGRELLEQDYSSPFAGLSRREVIKKVGLASLIALPVVSTIIAPSAANAASSTCPQGSPNPNGAPAGTTVSTTITNQSNDTTTNQNAAGANLRAQCCSNAYQNFISNGCSSGTGETCFATAQCI